jgi:hypothetical protein
MLDSPQPLLRAWMGLASASRPAASQGRAARVLWHRRARVGASGRGLCCGRLRPRIGAAGAYKDLEAGSEADDLVRGAQSFEKGLHAWPPMRDPSALLLQVYTGQDPGEGVTRKTVREEMGITSNSV